MAKIHPKQTDGRSGMRKINATEARWPAGHRGHAHQHADDDKGWMEDVLRRLKPLVKVGEVPPGYYAMLYDRTENQRGRPQLYGTQMICKGHKWIIGPLINPTGVDERRRKLGMRTSEEEYVKNFADNPPCVDSK